MEEFNNYPFSVDVVLKGRTRFSLEFATFERALKTFNYYRNVCKRTSMVFLWDNRTDHVFYTYTSINSNIL